MSGKSLTLLPDADGLGLVCKVLAAGKVVGLHGAGGGAVEVLGAAVRRPDRRVAGNLSYLQTKKSDDNTQRSDEVFGD